MNNDRLKLHHFQRETNWINNSGNFVYSTCCLTDEEKIIKDIIE